MEREDAEHLVFGVILLGVAVHLGVPLGMALAANVAGNVAYDVTMAATRPIRERLFGAQPDAYTELKALYAEAFDQAIQSLDQGLPRATYMDDARRKEVLRRLKEDARAYLEAPVGDAQISKLASAEARSWDSLTSNERYRAAFERYAKHLQLPDVWRTTLRTQLPVLVESAFGRLISEDTPRANRAWRAFQLMQFQQMRAEGVQAKHSLSELRERLETIPWNERDSIGTIQVQERLVQLEVSILTYFGELQGAVEEGFQRSNVEHAEILRAIHAWPRVETSAKTRRICPKPPEKPNKFGGRSVRLSEIKEQLFRGTDTAITAVHGAGGIGKTTLARALAAEMYADRIFRAVLWADITRNPNPVNILGSWVRSYADSAFDVTAFEGDERQIADAARGHLNSVIEEQCEACEPPRVLVVLDDVWDNGRDAVRLIKRACPDHSTILITTRSESVAIDVGATPQVLSYR